MDASVPVAAPLPPPSVPTGKLPGAGRALLIPLVENCIQEIKVAVEKGHAELKNRKSRATLKNVQMEEIIQAAIAEASSETSINNFTSPSQPIRRDPAWKTHAMSRSAFSYYHTAEYAEELAEKHTRRAEKAVAKAKKKTVRGNPSARSNKAATEKVKRAEFSQSVAINWRRKADRYWRTELALKSAGVSRRRVRAAATKAAENPPQPRRNELLSHQRAMFMAAGISERKAEKRVLKSICPGMSRRWHLNMPHRIYPLRMRPLDDTRPRKARRPLNDTRPRKVSRPVRMTRDSSSGGYYRGRYGGNYGGYYGGYYVGPSSWRYDLPAYTSMPRRDRYSIGPGGSTGFSFGGGFGGGMMGMSYGR